MKTRINPVGVFPKTATSICISAVEMTSSGDSKVSWHLLDENDVPIVFDDIIVGPNAHKNWGSNDAVVMSLTLAKLGLTAAE